MNIPSHELQAFNALSQVLNFSLAAEKVHITQSALSQRIQNLERRLGLTLFVRDRKALQLTEAGIRLLRYCQTQDHLQAELLNDLLPAAQGKLGGHLRIAAFSSVLHSVIIPALAPLLREHPDIRFEFSMHEMSDLPAFLLHGEADFVVMDHVYDKRNIQSHLLGHEHYVLLQSSRYPESNVYLDHDPNDRFTKLFFKSQNIAKDDIIRSYMDDIDGILRGIEHGIGKGVVPRHLISKKAPVQIVKDFKPMRTPVILNYFSQPYYSKLQKIVIDTLKNNCKKYLTNEPA